MTSVPTPSPARPEQALSTVESLPVEILLNIAEDAGPWLGYASPFLYGLLETKAEAHRKKTFKKAFTKFGTISKKGIAKKHDNALDYARVFSECVNLPWFNKAVFTCFKKPRASRWISPGQLKLWAFSLHGAWAMFGNTWTQAQGDFVSTIVTHWPGVVEGTSATLFPYQHGVLSAIATGCAVGIRALTQMNVEDADCEPEETYSQDPQLQKLDRRWVRRWTTQRAGTGRWPLSERARFGTAPVAEVMYRARIADTTPLHLSVHKAYLRCYWITVPNDLQFAYRDHGYLLFGICAVLRNWSRTERPGVLDDDEDAAQEMNIRVMIGQAFEKGPGVIRFGNKTRHLDMVSKYNELHQAWIALGQEQTNNEVSLSFLAAVVPLFGLSLDVAQTLSALSPTTAIQNQFDEALVDVRELHEKLRKRGVMAASIP